jgi:hypothetical protein
VDGDPDDGVLLELGRLTWAAMALEEVVYTVCRVVKPRHGPYDDHPIGARVAEGLRDLHDLDPPLQGTVRAWLVEAKDSLAARNSVLHSTHVVFEPLPGTTPIPATTGAFLAHFPRCGNGTQVQTPLTVAGLAPLCRRLEAARQDWVAVATGVFQARRAP